MLVFFFYSMKLCWGFFFCCPVSDPLLFSKRKALHSHLAASHICIQKMYLYIYIYIYITVCIYIYYYMHVVHICRLIVSYTWSKVNYLGILHIFLINNKILLKVNTHYTTLLKIYYTYF